MRNLCPTILALALLPLVPSTILAQTPGGKVINLGKWTPYGINDKGEICGDDGQNGWIYENGKAHKLGTLGFDVVNLNDINDSGNIVGVGLDYSSAAFSAAAILTNSKKKTTVIGNVGILKGNASEAYGINKTNEVVGSFEDVSEYSSINPVAANGFLYKGQKVSEIDGRSTGVVVNAINDSGEICGTFFESTSDYSSRAFYGSKNGKVTLFGPEGSEAVAINASGEVVGAYLDGGGFVYSISKKKFTNIPAGGDYSSSSTLYSVIPTDINDNGQVVGYVLMGLPSVISSSSSSSGSSSSSSSSYNTRAFSWQNGNMTLLTSILGSGESAAFSINNNGQIVGSYDDFSEGFLYSP